MGLPLLQLHRVLHCIGGGPITFVLAVRSASLTEGEAFIASGGEFEEPKWVSLLDQSWVHHKAYDHALGMSEEGGAPVGSLYSGEPAIAEVVRRGFGQLDANHQDWLVGQGAQDGAASGTRSLKGVGLRRAGSQPSVGRSGEGVLIPRYERMPSFCWISSGGFRGEHAKKAILARDFFKIQSSEGYFLVAIRTRRRLQEGKGSQ